MVPVPVFYPDGGQCVPETSVHLTLRNPEGFKILYTTDFSEPAKDGVGTTRLYRGPITLRTLRGGEALIRAVCISNNGAKRGVSVARAFHVTHEVDDTSSPASDAYAASSLNAHVAQLNPVRNAGKNAPAFDTNTIVNASPRQDMSAPPEGPNDQGHTRTIPDKAQPEQYHDQAPASYYSSNTATTNSTANNSTSSPCAPPDLHSPPSDSYSCTLVQTTDVQKAWWEKPERRNARPTKLITQAPNDARQPSSLQDSDDAPQKAQPPSSYLDYAALQHQEPSYDTPLPDARNSTAADAPGGRFDRVSITPPNAIPQQQPTVYLDCNAAGAPSRVQDAVRLKPQPASVDAPLTPVTPSGYLTGASSPGGQSACASSFSGWNSAAPASCMPPVAPKAAAFAADAPPAEQQGAASAKAARPFAATDAGLAARPCSADHRPLPLPKAPGGADDNVTSLDYLTKYLEQTSGVDTSDLLSPDESEVPQYVCDRCGRSWSAIERMQKHKEVCRGPTRPSKSRSPVRRVHWVGPPGGELKASSGNLPGIHNASFGTLPSQDSASCTSGFDMAGSYASVNSAQGNAKHLSNSIKSCLRSSHNQIENTAADQSSSAAQPSGKKASGFLCKGAGVTASQTGARFSSPPASTQSSLSRFSAHSKTPNIKSPPRRPLTEAKGLIACPHCAREMKPAALESHEKRCAENPAVQKQNQMDVRNRRSNYNNNNNNTNNSSSNVYSSSNNNNNNNNIYNSSGSNNANSSGNIHALLGGSGCFSASAGGNSGQNASFVASTGGTGGAVRKQRRTSWNTPGDYPSSSDDAPHHRKASASGTPVSANGARMSANAQLGSQQQGGGGRRARRPSASIPRSRRTRRGRQAAAAAALFVGAAAEGARVRAVLAGHREAGAAFGGLARTPRRVEAG
ncbi:hypothetical protein DIPPA_06564 [Diplonema papillatum]|nr:hypothetical protein DIPPA_06564 [Diplonema papillatum]KAJ9462356.1 hypothetical protein DIPPA_06564 [Diplonema papillatum]